MARFNTPRRRRGITLIESLATILVLAIVLPALMNGLSISTRAAGYAKRKAEATGLAEQKLNELVATGAIFNGNSNGDFGPEHPGYTWESAIGDWEEQNMQQVHVLVRWADTVQEYQIEVNTLVFVGSTASSQPAGTAGGGT